MDGVLCDELLQEIFTKLPSPPSSSSPVTSSSVTLVSKRWLHLYRSSKTSLCLRLTPNNSIIPSLSSLLSHYPYLFTLSFILSAADQPTIAAANFTDQLLFMVSSNFPNLKTLKLLPLPVSASALFSLSKTCCHVTTLTVSLSKHVNFIWVSQFSCLKSLSVYVCDFNVNTESEPLCSNLEFDDDDDAELGLESLCLSGIGKYDYGFGYLWRNCKKLKTLKLTSCESLGDGGSFSSFTKCVQGLEEIELRTCRSIVDGVLCKIADNSSALQSLLLYDGGSKDTLLHFFANCICNLRKLDLRLPLDLNNDHLTAIALNLRNLSTLRVQSSCLVTGNGLKSFGIGMSSGFQELALINCDVVERESGLLATLGQNFRHLRKLDLSYNEMLVDKEFVSMIVSCNYLTELKLRGCKRLTTMAAVSMFKCCKNLETVDIMHCCGIKTEAVEMLVLTSQKLRRIKVEDRKISDVARTWASRKCIEVVS